MLEENNMDNDLKNKMEELMDKFKNKGSLPPEDTKFLVELTGQGLMRTEIVGHFRDLSFFIISLFVACPDIYKMIKEAMHIYETNKEEIDKKGSFLKAEVENNSNNLIKKVTSPNDQFSHVTELSEMVARRKAQKKEVIN